VEIRGVFGCDFKASVLNRPERSGWAHEGASEAPGGKVLGQREGEAALISQDKDALAGGDGLRDSAAMAAVPKESRKAMKGPLCAPFFRRAIARPEQAQPQQRGHHAAGLIKNRNISGAAAGSPFRTWADLGEAPARLCERGSSPEFFDGDGQPQCGKPSLPSSGGKCTVTAANMHPAPWAG